jgi:hypothetical protein
LYYSCNKICISKHIVYILQKKIEKLIQFMIVTMILYFPHTILIKTLYFFSILHDYIQKLHHQIKNKSLCSMSKLLLDLPYHYIMLQCTPKTLWKKSNLNLPSKNKIQNPLNVYVNITLLVLQIPSLKIWKYKVQSQMC